MTTYTKEQVKAMLEQHEIYLRREDEKDKHDYRDTEALEGFPPGEKAVFVGAVLDGYDFSHRDLRGVDFRHASLRYAKFCYANLYSANIHSANLLRADFRYAVLDQSNMWACNARRADFRYAEMHGADLS